MDSSDPECPVVQSVVGPGYGSSATLETGTELYRFRSTMDKQKKGRKTAEVTK